MFGAVRYYLYSIFTLSLGVSNFLSVLWAILVRVGRHDKGFLVKLRGGYQFRVRSALDVWVLKEVILDREYEQIGPEIESGWTVVDIGAAYGEFSIPAARRIGHGRVIAIEPAPDTYALLLENIRINGADEVETYALAIGGRSETRRLHYSARGAVMNSTVESPTANGGVAVSMLSLGDFFEQSKIDQCDYLKIDCEGGEYDILLSATNTVLRRVRHLCLEYHEDAVVHTHKDLLDRLQSAGFLVWARENPVDASQGWIYAQRR